MHPNIAVLNIYYMSDLYTYKHFLFLKFPLLSCTNNHILKLIQIEYYLTRDITSRLCVTESVLTKSRSRINNSLHLLTHYFTALKQTNQMYGQKLRLAALSYTKWRTRTNTLHYIVLRRRCV